LSRFIIHGWISLVMGVSKRTSIIVVSIVAVLAVVAAFNTQALFKSDDYNDVTVDEAWDLIQGKPELVVLDVRTQAEYDDGHIEDAILIPVAELPDRLSELSKDDEILVYCRSGNRSSTAVGIMEDAGFSKIFHMNEGMNGWLAAGLPVV
jgi:rhodanese-related sulfurtransferase